MQYPRQTIISFDATRLVVDPVVLLALPAELLLGGPWPRPHGGIVDRDNVFNRVRPNPSPALDQMQVLARALKIGLRTEVRHIDDEGVAFPAPTRVAVPLADAGRQVGPSIHDDVALPALSLTHVVEDRDATRRLHDPAEAPAERGAEFGQPGGQAALPQRHVLRGIVAIDAAGVVARRTFSASRRRRRIVFAAAAGGRPVLARVGRLQQSKAEGS